MWEFVALDVITIIVAVGLALAVEFFLNWRTGVWLKEITRRGDDRAKEDQTGPWVRRG